MTRDPRDPRDPRAPRTPRGAGERHPQPYHELFVRYRLPRPDGTLVDRPAIVVAIDAGGLLNLNVMTDGRGDGYPNTPVLHRAGVPFSATPRANTWHWPAGYVPADERDERDERGANGEVGE